MGLPIYIKGYSIRNDGRNPKPNTRKKITKSTPPTPASADKSYPPPLVDRYRCRRAMPAF